MFVAPFRSPFSSPFPSSGAAAAIPWYLSGNVAIANCVAAYQPKGAASLAASYSNLANPGTYNAAPGVAPTFDASTGWTFNGSTQYLTTGITTSPQHADWSMIVRFSNQSGSYQIALGSYAPATGARFEIWPEYGGIIAYYSYNYITKSPNLTSGVLAISGTHGFRNGTNEATIASGGDPSNKYPALFLGAGNNGSGSPEYKFNGKIQAAAIYNTILSDAQVSAVTTAMNAL